LRIRSPEPRWFVPSRSRLTAALIATSISLSLTSCGDTFGSKEKYLRRGNEFAAAGKNEDAALQFRKAIQKDSHFGEAHLRYGQLLLRLNQPLQAYSSLSAAVESMPSSAEAKAELGRVSITALLADPRRPKIFYDTACRMANQLLEANANSAEGFRLKGYLAIADALPKEAIRWFRESLQANPNQPEVITVLAQSLILDQQGSEAERLLRNALSQKTSYSPLYDVLYGYYKTTNQPNEGEQVLKAKIAASPRSAIAILELAQHYRDNRNLPAMEAQIHQLTANPAGFDGALLEAGRFYEQIGRMDDAIGLYEKGAQTDTAHKKDYLQRIVTARLAQGRIAEAGVAVDILLKSYPDDFQTLAAKASLRMASGRPEEMAQAVQDFRSLVTRAPGNTDLRFRLAKALRQIGREDEAKSELLDLLRQDPRHRDALREVADIAIRNRQADEAIQYAERLLEMDPANTGARLVRTSAWALRSRFPEVRAELRRLTTADPDLTEAWLQMAALDVQEKKYAEAEQIFRRYYQPGNGDARSLRGIILVYLAQQQPQKALAAARAEAAASPGNSEVRVLLASTAAQSGDMNLALATVQKLVLDFPSDPDHLVFESELYLKAGKLQPAIDALSKARTLSPKNPGIAAQQAEALSQAGRHDEAIAASRQALALRPNDIALTNALAWHLALAGRNPEEAEGLARQALKREPGNSAFADTLGMVWLTSRKFEAAEQAFRQLVNREPANPVFHLHLAKCLLDMGQPAKARVELEAAMRTHPALMDAETINSLLKQTQP